MISSKLIGGGGLQCPGPILRSVSSPLLPLSILDGCARRHYAKGRTVTYYEILEVDPKVNQAHIKSAYYKLSKQYHPDLNKSQEAKSKFEAISKAYEILGNIPLRRQYDRELFPATGNMPGRGFVPGDTYKPDKLKRHMYNTKKGKFTMGRVDIYNYDEFYRQHYGEFIGREKMAKEARGRLRKENKEHKDSFEKNSTFFNALLISGAVVFIYRVYKFYS